MQIKNGTIFLKDAAGITVNLSGETRYRDTDNNYISIQNKLIIRLYECLKHYVVENKLDFDEYQKHLFNKESE